MRFTDWFTQHEDNDVREHVRIATMLRMPEGDRVRTREMLTRYMAHHPAHIREQARTSRSLSILFHPMPIVASLLIVIVSGASVAAAAESSLPGDTLYAIKVNINEEVKLALATTPTKKAEVTLARAETRISEVETLESRGTISESVRTEIEDRIDAHVAAAENLVDDTDDESAEAHGRDARLVALLRAHETLLSGDDTVGGSLATDVTLDEMARAFGTASEASDSLASTASEPSTTGEPVALMALMVSDNGSPADETTTRASAPVAKRAMESQSGEMHESETVPAHTASTSSVMTERDARTVERLRKTADNRISSFEKQLQKLRARINSTELTDAQETLARAMDAREKGEEATNAGSVSDASVFFNIAIRTAIDGRETLLKSRRDSRTELKNSSTEKMKDDETGSSIQFEDGTIVSTPEDSREKNAAAVSETIQNQTEDTSGHGSDDGRDDTSKKKDEDHDEHND